MRLRLPTSITRRAVQHRPLVRFCALRGYKDGDFTRYSY